MSSHVLIISFAWVLASVAVGVHAMDRDRSPFFWGVLTIVTGLIGLAAYIIVIGNELDDPDRDPETVVVCPNCSTRYSESPAYCSDCGEPLADRAERSTASILRSGSTAYCGNCHSTVEADADECPSCGSVF